MQLPPTIISIDKKEKKTKIVPSSKKSEKKPSGGKTSKVAADKAAPAPEPTPDDGQDASESSGGEGDPGIASDPEAPLKTAPKDPRKTGTQAVLRPPRTLETTLFERLEKMYGPGIKRMLTVQYR